MKHSFYSLLLFAFFISCNTQGDSVKTDTNTIKPPSTVREVVGIGEILPEQDIIQLSSPVNGIVRKIYKNENDSVSVGTPILELDHQLEDAKTEQLHSEMNTQSAQITADKAAVGEYEAKYSNAVSEVQRLKRLLAKGAETQQAVDDASTNVKSFASNRKRLLENVEVSRNKLEETKAAFQSAKIEQRQKIIVSPVNGKILELPILIGGAVNTQQSLAQIQPVGKTIAVCEIDELYAGKIAVGQKAFIRNVGSPDTLSTGTVYFTFSFLKKKSLFTDQSGEKEDRRVRTIKILLDKPDKLLLNARIECVIAVADTINK